MPSDITYQTIKFGYTFKLYIYIFYEKCYYILSVIEINISSAHSS